MKEFIKSMVSSPLGDTSHKRVLVIFLGVALGVALFVPVHHSDALVYTIGGIVGTAIVGTSFENTKYAKLLEQSASTEDSKE